MDYLWHIVPEIAVTRSLCIAPKAATGVVTDFGEGTGVQPDKVEEET